jgi:predicted phage terminase large subunit-like protein
MLEGTKVLWPQCDSYYDLMVLRETEGDIYFQREKQNCPLDPRQCIFKKENLLFWDDEFRDTQHLIASVGKRAAFYGACDPGMGRSTKADFTAIVVLLKDIRTKITYVIAADLLHCPPGEAIDRIVEYARMYHFSQFAVESNNFQQLMIDELKRRLQIHGLRMNIKSQHHSVQKVSRISSLEPYVSQGLVRFSRKHQDLLRQLTQFPLAKNDDGPDALEMAVSIARKPRLPVGGIGVLEKYRDI